MNSFGLCEKKIMKKRDTTFLTLFLHSFQKPMSPMRKLLAIWAKILSTSFCYTELF